MNDENVADSSAAARIAPTSTIMMNNDEKMAMNMNITNEVYLKFGRPISNEWSEFPGLPFAFEFESNFNRDYHRQWMYDNWYIAIYVSIIYIMVIFTGRWLMTNRQPYSLRTPMALWNLAIALFSLFGTIRCLPEFIHIITQEGIEQSFCSSSYYRDVRITLWYWLFVWSKVIELGDTIFIILRKQNLIFLHWIHHVLTLSYAFFVIGDAPGTARWMVSMNFTIHTSMYTYYTLKAMRFRISRLIAMTITIAQITQMIFGLYINMKAYLIKQSGQSCDTSISASLCGLFIYFLFFLLFIKFFVFSYCSRFPLIGLRKSLRTTTTKTTSNIKNNSIITNNSHSTNISNSNNVRSMKKHVD
ncbi:hypothetical protein DERF_014687 [Dermatophagoides farinae]|uniref:Elongation of very long chain fatty acids protein n=1 Tax=Dermatophagoides farinae TaxID=6954 RepID=A0A922KTJ7_DERFA|nr:elongation of very long chain fatty acids protein 6-like [Dermatophagoides farinae]KAH7644168.1 elongation of very long chain fatty acids-like protein 1 [Dermatophagoides farinae]KAH9493963.1 hypothetical protein DERF_014687 [Dermatophagoides farinae]